MNPLKVVNLSKEQCQVPFGKDSYKMLLVRSFFKAHKLCHEMLLQKELVNVIQFSLKVKQPE